MELGLKEKNVLIVGASKGIGRGIVEGFAKEGSRLVLIARTEELLKEVRSEAEGLGAASCRFEVHDIMECDTHRLAEALVESYGLFDVVVHNVGTSLVSRNYVGPADDWNHALRLNAVAAVDMNSVFLPAMMERGSGHVIHISSISGVMLRGNPLYASAKAFLNAYVTTVGRSIAASGVTLCSVMPGAVTFPGGYWDRFIREGHPRVEAFLEQHQAVKRFGTPEEIANLVLFLASEKASFMQAANIPIDGANM